MSRFTNWMFGSRKSISSLGVGLRAALGGSGPGGWASDHREETAHNTGFNYIAIHAIASQVAGATVTAFADGDHQQRYQSRRKSLARQMGSFTRWKSIYGADDRETDPLPISHPLVRLLKRPNPYESGATFRYRQAQQIRLTGTCLVWNVPSRSGPTCERYVIPTAMASPVAPTRELPQGGWRINPVAARYTPVVDDAYVDCPTWYRILGQIVDARQVQVIRLPHAWYLDDGQSPLSAGAKWVDAGNAVDEARYHQLKNGIDPSIVWNLPPDVSPDQNEIDRTQAKIAAKYGGPENVGRVLVAQSGTTITPLSSSPREMCYSEGFQDLKSATLALHQTPPVAVGLQESGAYAAYNASMKAWRHAAIQPLCDLLAESETEHLAPQFGAGLTVEIESDTVDDTDLLERQLQNDLAAKVRTKNEWRAVRGMPPLPGPEGNQIVGTDGASANDHSSANGNPPGNEPADSSKDHSSESGRAEKSVDGWTDHGSHARQPEHGLTPLRTRLIAQILHRLYGPSAITRLESDWDFSSKSFDEAKHPHGRHGYFISRLLANGESSADPKEVMHHLSKVSTRQLIKLHEQHGIGSVPADREHLERSVLSRVSQFQRSHDRTYLTPTGSRKVSVHIQHAEKVNARLPKALSGDLQRPLTSKQWGRLVGAQRGAKVHVFPTGLSSITIVVDHPHYMSRRTLRGDTIHNEFMVVDPKKQKSGLGLRVFKQQVETAKQHGFKFIEAGAAGSGTRVKSPEEDWKLQGLDKPIGYYTWARFGFEGDLRPLMKQRANSQSPELRRIAADFKRRFPGTTNVAELMKTKRARDWWNRWGGYFEGRYDLRDNSRSEKILKRYDAEKRKLRGRKAYTQMPQFLELGQRMPRNDSTTFKGSTNTDDWRSIRHAGLYEELGLLSEADEEILDRIWDEITEEENNSKVQLIDVSETDPDHATLEG